MAVTALVAALIALPLPPIAQGPEIAATLAVGAVVALAGLRWGVALLVMAEALLVATLWPVVVGGADDVMRATAAVACAAALPGLWSIRRAAPHALELLGIRRNRATRRAARHVLALGALLVVALPLL